MIKSVLITVIVAFAVSNVRAEGAPSSRDEVQLREAIGEEFDASFMQGDFASIEARYAMWMATGARSSSGLFLDNVMLRNMLPSRPRRSRVVSGDAAPPADHENHWSVRLALAEKWAREAADSVLPALVMSHIYLQQGFEHRGAGFAHTVTEEGWQQYRIYVQKAQDTLLSRRTAGKKDPNWWAEMLRLGNLQSMPMENFQAMATAAMTAFPQRYDIYFTISHRLAPQWGGSLEHLASFADEAVRRTWKTDGKALYARIYWNLFFLLGADALKDPQVQWPKIRAGFEDMIKQYPAPWNINFYARMACAAGDKDAVKRIAGRVQADPVPSLWPTRSAFNRCLEWGAS